MKFAPWKHLHRCLVCGCRYSLFCLECHLNDFRSRYEKDDQ